MLAYVFWHRPCQGVQTAAYEEAQQRFHERVGVPSGCFRVEVLPFAAADDAAAGGGYEDWYLVEGWAELGELNEAAVDARRRKRHDRAAALAGDGWGAVYRHVRGEMAIPAETSWQDKPRGEPLDTLLQEVPAKTPVWRRQLVLGPAPEICIGSGGPKRFRL